MNAQVSRLTEHGLVSAQGAGTDSVLHVPGEPGAEVGLTEHPVDRAEQRRMVLGGPCLPQHFEAAGVGGLELGDHVEGVMRLCCLHGSLMRGRLDCAGSRGWIISGTWAVASSAGAAGGRRHPEISR